jgi:hypothetical protein
MQLHAVTGRRLGVTFDALNDGDCVTTAEAAVGLGRTPETLRRWRQQRKFLPFIALPGVVMYRVGDLRAFLRSARVEPDANDA